MATRLGGHLRRAAPAGALLALAAAVAGASAAAQERPDRDPRECRCVDAEGNEIAGCVCLRAWAEDGRRVLSGFLPERSRGRLGITVDVDQAAEADVVGARVRTVVEGGPADAAGLRSGDVLTRLDGRSLIEPLGAGAEEDFDLDGSIPAQRLIAIARELEPGEEVDVEYVRDGETRRATVTAGDVPMWGRTAFDYDFEALGDRLRGLGEGFRWHGPGPTRLHRSDAWTCPGGGREGGSFRLALPGRCPGGLELLELSEGLAGYFGVEEGALVSDVHPDSGTGLEPGDVIVRIGERAVDSAERARRILGSYEPGEEVRFRVVRRGSEVDVLGRLDR